MVVPCCCARRGRGPRDCAFPSFPRELGFSGSLLRWAFPFFQAALLPRVPDEAVYSRGEKSSLEEKGAPNRVVTPESQSPGNDTGPTTPDPRPRRAQQREHHQHEPHRTPLSLAPYLRPPGSSRERSPSPQPPKKTPTMKEPTRSTPNVGHSGLAAKPLPNAPHERETTPRTHPLQNHQQDFPLDIGKKTH